MDHAGLGGGAVVTYGLGAWLGRERFVALWTRLPLIEEEDLARSDDWFARHGRTAVFVGRMVPGVRSVISVPAGIQRMPMGQFLLYTAAGSLLWNLFLIMAGYLLGDRYEVVTGWMDRFSTALWVLAALAVLAFVVIRVRHRRDHADSAAE